MPKRKSAPSASPSILLLRRRAGVSKSRPGFFRRIVDESGVAPNEIAYVGDRLDNDVLPAVDAGMGGIF